MIFSAEVSIEGIPFFFFFGGVAEAVGTAPKPHADAKRGGMFGNRRIAARILGAELFTVFVAVAVGGAVIVAGIPRIDFDLHAVGAAQIVKKIQIDVGLLFRRAFIGVVDPGEILRNRGRCLIGTGILAPLFGMCIGHDHYLSVR